MIDLSKFAPEQVLKLGIEAIALIKADGLYDQDIEAGRADALDDTVPLTFEQLKERDGGLVTEDNLKWYNEVYVPAQRDRLNKQAKFVAEGLIKYLHDYFDVPAPIIFIDKGNGN